MRPSMLSLFIVCAVACGSSEPPAPEPVQHVLDRRGGLRITYELQLADGADERAAQEQVVRALRARFAGIGVVDARVYWLDRRQVVVELPGFDSEARARAATEQPQAPGLPVTLVAAEESVFGPSIERASPAR